MKGVVYFIISVIGCFIISIFLVSRVGGSFPNPQSATFGVICIVVGIGGFFTCDEPIVFIALFITGIFASIYGINGNFGLLGEAFDDLILRKGYN